MPVINYLSGLWNVAYDLGLNNYPIVAESINHGFDISINRSGMISGAGDTMVFYFDMITGKYDINGPILFGPVEDIQYPEMYYDLEMFYPACTRYYASILSWETWAQIYEPISYFASGMLDTINVKFDVGSNCSVSWFQDPPLIDLSNLGAGHLYIADDFGRIDVPPMRAGSFYDFIVYIDGYALPIKSFSFSYKIDYEIIKPIGGADIFMGLDYYSEEYTHTPIRFYRSHKANANMQFVALLTTITPWGAAVPWEAPVFSPSSQYHDLAMHESPNIDVTFMVSGRTAIWDLVPRLPIGIYINNVKTSYRPGISDVSVDLDFIIPI